ncbi:leucyl aminopeptidase family protein [Temperatibacter marinus]|uniref:Leucyl aminopeptidase family protein n=1 Tax=Temperatibacter marinus TaxID=1456591 RepID=A0AA52EHL7_9PROT|nr:leucyl aminopeptidase family protein [Temperatibacter marinus]WND03318.1 leucyl aminopeptidase family protein [Temperatibacter marinus]
MTDFSPYLSDQLDGSEITLIPVTVTDLDDPAKITPSERQWMDVHGFTAKQGSFCFIAGKKGDLACAFVGVGDENPKASDLWWLASIAASLPAGRFAIAEETVDEAAIKAAALGWVLAQYDFAIYKEQSDRKDRVLCLGGVGNLRLITHITNAVALVRDMVNTPTEDMGPAHIQAIIEALAEEHGAIASSVSGQVLKDEFPAIHAVGRAAAEGREPRLLELNWQSDKASSDSLTLAIVGKGVCFDTGGLNLKPGGSMELMKKDMGGAAHAIALASLIMAEELPLKMQLLVPAVENAVAGNAFRPGDIIDTRLGKTVEIGNTDAEGRLILCDALTYASETSPDVMLDFATLTGAARVALGPDLPATFCNDDALFDRLNTASHAVGDPLWRLPLWAPYDELLNSPNADMNNISGGPFAGSITAGLYLQRFVGEGIKWVHFDTFAWNPVAKAGRPKGGEALGLRASFQLIIDLIAAD